MSTAKLLVLLLVLYYSDVNMQKAYAVFNEGSFFSTAVAYPATCSIKQFQAITRFARQLAGSHFYPYCTG